MYKINYVLNSRLNNIKTKRFWLMKPFENRKSKTASGDCLKERAGPVDRIQRTKKIENQMTKKMTKQLKKQKTIRPNSTVLNLLYKI